jgi:hypothetical protein
MKIFPTCDLTSMPYRFETRSVNSIVGIESALADMWTLLRAAHTIRQFEEQKPISFDGLFGAKFFLVHRKIRSGGREVFITDLFPSPDFNQVVMQPIMRGLAQKKSMANLTGAAGTLPILEQAAERLLSGPAEVPQDIDSLPSTLDLADQQGIAVNFGADAAEEVVTTAEVVDDKERNQAVASLIEDGPPKP